MNQRTIVLIFLTFSLNACKNEPVQMLSSSGEQQLTNTANEHQEKGLQRERNHILYSLEKTVRLVKQAQLNGETLNHKKDLKLIYSVSMHVDSFFMVTYQPVNYEHGRDDIFSTDINTKDWLDVKLEIIDIYERIVLSDYPEPDTGGIEARIARYEFDKSLPILMFHASSFEFLKKLIELKDKIKYIDVNAVPLLTRVGKRSLEESILCGYDNEPPNQASINYTSNQEPIS